MLGSRHARSWSELELRESGVLRFHAHAHGAPPCRGDMSLGLCCPRYDASQRDSQDHSRLIARPKVRRTPGISCEAPKLTELRLLHPLVRRHRDPSTTPDLPFDHGQRKRDRRDTLAIAAAHTDVATRASELDRWRRRSCALGLQSVRNPNVPEGEAGNWPRSLPWNGPCQTGVRIMAICQEEGAVTRNRIDSTKLREHSSEDLGCCWFGASGP